MSRRLSGLRWPAMVVALVMVAAPALPASANHAPPPGDVVTGSGSLEGTELLQDEEFTGSICFRATKSIFGLRGTGTYTGRTAGGQEVVYRADIGQGETLYGNGPLRVEVENTATYYHGPYGTHGTSDTSCAPATAGSPVPAEFRIFAPDHVYRLDGTNAQVPCKGQGSFARGDGASGDPARWVAEWTLAEDCVVVGNQAGSSGTGVASAGTTNTHHGSHRPCFNPPCQDNIQVDYKQYPPVDGLHAGMSGPDSAWIGEDPVTVVARITNDGAPVPSATVSFLVEGPAPAAPPGGVALTSAEGRASFTFTAGLAGDYTVTSSVTYAGETASASHAVRFNPPPPPAMALAGPTEGQTEEGVTLIATFTRAGDPVRGTEVAFQADGEGAGEASPPTGKVLTDANGRAAFTFAGNRAGDYAVTASASSIGQDASATRTVHLDINTFYRVASTSFLDDEVNPTEAVVDPTGAFAYFAGNNKLVKVDLTNFQRVGAFALPSTDYSIETLAIDPGGAFAYLGTRGTASRVLKVDLGTLQAVDTITLEPDEDWLGPSLIDPAGHYAFIGSAGSGSYVDPVPGKVVKINLDTFERVGSITLEPGEIYLDSGVMDPGGNSAYFATSGTSDVPAAIVKIDLTTFQRVGALTLNGSDEMQMLSAVVDPKGAFAYFGTWSSPGRVVKIDLGTFQRVAALTLAEDDMPDIGPYRINNSESDLYTAVMDPAGRYAYFGTVGHVGSLVGDPRDPSIPARLIRIDLTTFERVDHLELPAASENTPRAAVIDPAGNYAYFGAQNTALRSPGLVVKVAVRRPPKATLAAAPDSYSTPYVTPLGLSAPGVLANDVDTGDGDPLSAGQASDPAHGDVALNADGSFTYTPEVGFSGIDTFTYTASDGMDYSAPATVSVTVAPPPEGIQAVSGGAFGYYSNASLFGGPYEQRGPAPTVSLAANASNSPASAHSDTGAATYGPAHIFESGPIDVHADAALGRIGYAATSSTIQGIADRSQQYGPFIYDGIASSCRADRTGTDVGVTITNGVVETSYYIGDDPNTERVERGGDVKTSAVVPLNPSPGYTIEGSLDHIGDSFRIVFNEQTTNADGSRTVDAAHMYLLGPTAVGDLFIGRSSCGIQGDLTSLVKAVADFDGDSDTDRSVFRNGAWYAEGQTTAYLGQTGDIAVPGDYDGDRDA
ncbi:MAG TPA: Ig-like domain-containing protein, partial [Acidimicrobiales bacterium]|nr:Ig-like domain-containing protein [Acidimicrobiales bacterium]